MKLIISEKPSVGMTIAKALGGKFTRQDGYIENSNYIISWCLGHLVSLADAEAYDEKYSKWVAADLPIIPKEWKFVVLPDRKEQFGVIKKLMNDQRVDEVVCATDAGREGELIFRLVYNQAKCKKPFKRLWTSSLEENVIRDGFKNLKNGSEYDNLYASALCRAKSDWLVGINATRMYTKLYNRRLNVGRVQTPTLALIFERDFSIKNFVKEKYFNLYLQKDKIRAVLRNIPSEDESLRIKSECEKAGRAEVIRVSREEKKVSPSKLYDLTSLQREANRKYGFTAEHTLSCTQSLYEKKLVTYPRTDSKFITADMSDSVLNIIGILNKITEGIPKDFTPDISLVVNDKKVTDHHAIIPTKNIEHLDITSISEDENKILSLIKNRLLAAVYRKHIYESITAEIDCAGNIFTAKAKNITDNGWKEIDSLLKGESEEPEEDEEDVISGINIVEGDILESPEFEAKQLYTSPPKHYTEDTLLSAMERAGASETVDEAERKGLGTPATRAGIIERLVKCNYIVRDKKNLKITEEGETLLSIASEEIKSAKLTSDWENRLADIVSGKAEPNRFVDDIEEFTSKLIDNAQKSIDRSKIARREYNNADKEVIGKCPRCGKNVIELPKSYSCEDRDCGFVLWKDNGFFKSVQKNFTKTTAKGLLKGKVKVKGLTSKRGKKYDAIISLDDDGQRVNFKLEFE